MGLGRGLKGRDLRTNEPIRQGQMELKLFHHIGIAVSGQQLPLPGRQSFRTTACDIFWGQGGAERLQPQYDTGGQIGQGCGVTLGDQRQKALQPDHGQSLNRHRPQAGSEGGHSLTQHNRRDAVGQPEGWLDRAMEPIAAWGGRQIGHAGHIGLRHGLSGPGIPTQPMCGSIGKGTVARREIDRKAFHLFHARPPNRRSSHACDSSLSHRFKLF